MIKYIYIYKSVFIEIMKSNLQLIIKSSGGNVPDSLGPFTHERAVVGVSSSQLMTETTLQFISILTLGHKNASLARHAQCGTFPAVAEGSSSVQECVLCARLETRRGGRVPAVSTRVYDPGAGGGAAILACFVVLGWGRLRGVAVPRSCWPAWSHVWPPRWSPSTGAAPTPSE